MRAACVRAWLDSILADPEISEKAKLTARAIAELSLEQGTPGEVIADTSLIAAKATEILARETAARQ